MAISRLVVLFLLGLSLAWADCPCPEPDVDYCPSSVRFPSTSRVTCTSFGRGHINTFDGLAYDFREFGDFWLVSSKAGSFSNFYVQVRQASCTTKNTMTVPITASSRFSSTCNQAFIIGEGTDEYELSHTLNSDSLNVLYNGAEVDFSGGSQRFIGLSAITVQPVKYLNPYENLWRDRQPYLNDADFYARIDYSSGNHIEVYFYSSGEATVQIHLPDPTAFGPLGGLCGFPDGCPANDLYILPNSPYTPSTDQMEAAEDHIAEVRTGTSDHGAISAGNLAVGDRFIADQSNPGSWVPLFGTVWRVDKSDLEFSNTAENYNIREYSSSYSQAGGSCSSMYPKFLDKACAFDVSNGDDPDQWERLSSLHVMVGYCLDYCDNGQFVEHNTQLQPYMCNGICQYAQDSTIDLHGPYNADNPPPNQLQVSPGGDSILFTSTLNLAGQYSFTLTSSDFCESRSINLTRTIKCSRGISVPTPQTRYVKAVNGYGGWPLVRLQARSDSSVTRASWKFLEWPRMEVFGPPTIRFDMSFFPTFTPEFPGTYVLELALYNGCSIKRQNFTVVALCPSCPPQAQIDLASLKEIIWGMNFDSASTGPVLSPSPKAFPRKDLASVDHGEDAPKWSSVIHQWTIADDDFQYDDLEQIVQTSTSQFEVHRFPNVDVRDFAQEYPDGLLVNTTESHDESEFTVTGPPEGPPYTLTKLRGPIATQFGVHPPQREYDITRLIIKTPTFVTRTNTTAIAELYQFARYDVPCVLQFDSGVSGSPDESIDVLPMGSPDPAVDFVVGSRCVRNYNLNLTVSYCNSSTDVQTLQVECGPVPEAYIFCTQSVEYDFTTQTWPGVTVDGSGSVDPYGRGPLEFDWRFADTAPFSNLSNEDLCGTPYNCANNVGFTPDAPGMYKIEMETSNGCESSTESTTVEAVCDTPALTAAFSFPDGNSIDYSDALWDPAAQIQSGATTASGGFLLYEYTLTSSPASPFSELGYFPEPVPLPGFDDPTFANATFTPVLAGQYTIRQNVTHGCLQFDSVSRTLTVRCDQAIGPVMDLDSQGATATVEWVEATGFPSVVLNASESTFTLGTYPSVPTSRNFQWYVDGVRVSTAETTNYNVASTLASVRTIDLFASDGCQYQRATGTINYVCLDKEAVIATSSWPTGSIISGTTLDLIGSDSTGPSDLSYSWVLVNAPADSAATIVNPSSVNASFTPIVMTAADETYEISLTVCDGCSCDSTTVSFTVRCGDALSPVITVTYPTSGAFQVTWASNAFARVELNGDSSDLGGRDPATISYQWHVLAAPELSIFYPGPYVTYDTLPIVNDSFAFSDDDYSYLVETFNFTNEEVTTTYTVELAPNFNNREYKFPSCIYADLEGTYQVQLTLSDGCQVRTATANVNAACDGLPTPSVTVREAANSGSFVTQAPDYNADAPSYNVTLARDRPRRVVLDATESINYSNSRMEFYWSWAEPDPRAGTALAQDGIEKPYSSLGALELTTSGYYYLNLTINDGCGVNWMRVTLYASCGPQPLRMTTSESVTVSAGGSSATNLQTLFIESGVECANINSWIFANFTEASAGVMTRPASLLLTLVALAFALLL